MVNSFQINQQHLSFPPPSSMSSSLSSGNTEQKELTSLWADKAATSASTAAPPNATKEPKGSRSINHASKSIKAIPRSDRVTFCAGRPDEATTETALIEYLKEFGVSDVNCKKLVAKNGWQFNTSAIRASRLSSYKDIICYDEGTCPVNVELRDWLVCGSRNLRWRRTPVKLTV